MTRPTLNPHETMKIECRYCSEYSSIVVLLSLLLIWSHEFWMPILIIAQQFVLVQRIIYVKKPNIKERCIYILPYISRHVCRLTLSLSKKHCKLRKTSMIKYTNFKHAKEQ